MIANLSDAMAEIGRLSQLNERLNLQIREIRPITFDDLWSEIDLNQFTYHKAREIRDPMEEAWNLAEARKEMGAK